MRFQGLQKQSHHLSRSCNGVVQRPWGCAGTPVVVPLEALAMMLSLQVL